MRDRANRPAVHYLLYDSECPACARLADSLREAAGGRLGALSLHGEPARALLDRAYPAGWAFAPYLATVHGERVRAWTGPRAAIRLGFLLGPRRARRLWALASRTGAGVPGAAAQDPGWLSRRAVLERSGLGAVALILASSGRHARLAPDLKCRCICFCQGGPHVSAARIAHDALHLTLTFHATGEFDAHILASPPRDPNGVKLRSLGHRVPIGHHKEGPGTVSIALGTLKPGRYGVIVTPVKPPRKVTQKTAATWVYFTEEKGGKATGIKLIQPPPD
jgi:predicted DCC family thiol-disulfide oxidoreductase YuxK